MKKRRNGSPVNSTGIKCAGPFERIEAVLKIYAVSWLLLSAHLSSCQKIPAPDTFSLKNGVKACLLQTDGDSTVAFKIHLRAGRMNESECEVGYSEVIQRLLEENFRKRLPRTNSHRISFKSVDGELTVNGSCRRQELKMIMSALAGALIRPVFAQSVIDTITTSVIQSYLTANMRPSRLSRVFMDLLLYGAANPLGRSFCQYQLQKLTVRGLREFYFRNYTPRSASIVCCGSVNAGDMKKLVARHFVLWKPVMNDRLPVKVSPPPCPARKVAFVDAYGSQRCLLRWALRAPSGPSRDQPGFSACRWLLHRYVSADNARSGDTVSVQSFDGRLELTCRTSLAGMLPAMQRFDTALSRLAHGKFSRQELRSAIDLLERNSEDVRSPRAVLGFYDPLIYDPAERCLYREALKTVTDSCVRRLAAEYFDPKHCLLVIVGDGRAAAVQLSALQSMRYHASEFETCDERCREVVVLNCHCDACYRRGKCHVWRFNAGDKEGIRKALARQRGR
jgi:hypothetical protein